MLHLSYTINKSFTYRHYNNCWNVVIDLSDVICYNTLLHCSKKLLWANRKQDKHNDFTIRSKK